MCQGRETGPIFSGMGASIFPLPLRSSNVKVRMNREDKKLGLNLDVIKEFKVLLRAALE